MGGVTRSTRVTKPDCEVCFSADGSRQAAYSRSHEVAVWDLPGQRLVRVWLVPPRDEGARGGPGVNLGRHRVGVASERTVKRWNVDTGEVKNAVKLRPGLGNALAFAGPDKLLLFR